MALFKKKLSLDEILEGIANLSDEEKAQIGEKMKDLYKSEDEREIDKIEEEKAETPEVAEEKGEAVAEETAFGLSAFAKAIAAVFCAVIVTMFTMICINTQIINEKASKLAELEKQQRTLIQRSVKLKNQLEDATSDETIEEFARQFGMVKAE
jgi:cell division protein FtsL